MEESRKLSGKDLITIGIFSAIYFVLNLAAMITGFVPVLWLLLPGVTGIVTGIPFLLMASKVRKPGAVLIMGTITALLYFVTGQFTVLLLITFAIACILSELYRAVTKYDNSFTHMMISFVFFCYGMLGSPLAIWVYKDSFLAQIQQNGMSAEYVQSLSGLISTPMLIVLCISPVIGVINHLDPRAGLWLLLMANIGMFCQKNSEQGSMLSGIFLLLMLVHGLYKAAGKGIVLLVSFHLLLMYVFPQCPAWMNMVFPVLVNYSLRMLPCVLAGLLLLRTSSMQKMIAAMYTLHLPQGFIIAMSTTLRYFPALKEEFVHINAAMKLQNISWASRLECTVVPLIVSAVNTSDEIAAAAVARGIENPGKKTSEITLHMGISDWLIMILVTFGILIVVIAG